MAEFHSGYKTNGAPRFGKTCCGCSSMRSDPPSGDWQVPTSARPFSTPCSGTRPSPRLSLTQALCINLVLGENDDHRTTANFTIIVHFRRHFIRMRDSDFKNFKTSWASDFSEFHGADLHRIQISPTAESLLGSAKIQVSPTPCQFKPLTTPFSKPRSYQFVI